MARTLTVSRVRVLDGKDGEYLTAVQELAGLAEARGWHLWVFRSRDDPRLFLECSESTTAESHRAVAHRPADERRIEERLRSIATYDSEAWDMWEAIRSDH